MLSVDVGGQEMMAILERDDVREEASMETVNISSHRLKGGSPGRLIKAAGTEAQIRDLYATQPHQTLAVDQDKSTGFVHLQ